MTRASRLLLVLVVMASACSFSIGGLDTEGLAADIGDAIEQQSPGVEVTSVVCPDSVQPEQGNVFECTVTASDGSSGTVEVEQLDDDGNVSWEITEVMEAMTDGQ